MGMNPWTRVGQRWEDSLNQDTDKELAYRYAPERIRAANPKVGWESGDQVESAKTLTEAEREIKALTEDIGMGGYDLKRKWVPQGALGDAVGDYTHRLGTIRGLPDADHFLGTEAHELAHAADRTKDGYDSPTSWSGRPYKMNQHHKHYEDFHNDFGDQLRAQRRIEFGEPVPKEILARMPWLKQVNPMSSNRLANPWRKPEDPEWVTNAKWRGSRLTQDIRDAEKHEKSKRGE